MINCRTTHQSNILLLNTNFESHAELEIRQVEKEKMYQAGKI